MKSLFEFRNAIAHGRDEEIKLDGKAVPKSKSGMAYVEAVEAKWVAYCNFENAKRWFEDIKQIALDLSERANVKMPGYPFGSLESSMVKIVEDGV